MAGASALILVLGIVSALLWQAIVATARSPYNVSFEHRALVIDGKRRILNSAGIHYPRATPEMWQGLIAKAKQGGADVIQSYVFWSGHEPSKGKYNFEQEYDLVRFIKLVDEAGLFFNLRIGPYVCAEWNFGGFPVWLRDIPGIQFRTNNTPFKEEMRIFVKQIVDLMKDSKLFSWQGGPIILAQIENEYGNIEGEYGAAGVQYVKWAAQMALELDAGVPWTMCQQEDAPTEIINTCNAFYCDEFIPNAKNKPKLWTENWNGWFQSWGQPVPHRPVEENAFAVARFFQRGGSYQNYYMYFGGTNFGRVSGGPFITTSYDYDAPINEYGLISQPKWGHLKDLHTAIKLAEPALVSIGGDPAYLRLGPQQEAHVYSDSSEATDLSKAFSSESGKCAAFLSNTDTEASATVKFNGKSYDLPPWSVSILPDCQNVVYNTAQVRAQTSLHSFKLGQRKEVLKATSPYEFTEALLTWESYQEPRSISKEQVIKVNRPLEQINATKDSTDYMWYFVRVNIADAEYKPLVSRNYKPSLSIANVRDAVHIYVNGELAGSATGRWIKVDQPVKLQAGRNEIAVLCMTVGLQNSGPNMEKEGAGIEGTVTLQDLPFGDRDLTTSEWVHQVGLKGEELELFTNAGAGAVSWALVAAAAPKQPLTWYKAKFDAPDGTDPVSLDLGSMGKGVAWVNGHSLGRFWPSLIAAHTSACDTCDYRGSYGNQKCATGCGEPSQRWYHVPRAWLRPKDNLLVLLEELTGDPSGIRIATRSLSSVCGHVSSNHPPPLESWGIQMVSSAAEAPQPELRLECDPGQRIAGITFASLGNPQGSCRGEGFQQGPCHLASSQAVVEQACLGHNRCLVKVSVATFGGDPCPGSPISLAVQATCKSDDLECILDDTVTPSEVGNHWQRPQEAEHSLNPRGTMIRGTSSYPWMSA